MTVVQKISEENPDLTVTVVQPANLGLDGLIELTNKADSNIVVWPEASAWYSGNAFSTDKRIIGGFFRREESKTFTAVIDASNGEGYNKHNLVPFGEFQPFGDLLIGINSFFNITNWAYGESFYYTELCAYIHSQLSTQISSVVIVGSDAESVFGDLFEITSGPNELFYSTATVDNIEIINSFTDQNLKKGS